MGNLHYRNKSTSKQKGEINDLRMCMLTVALFGKTEENEGMGSEGTTIFQLGFFCKAWTLSLFYF